MFFKHIYPCFIVYVHSKIPAACSVYSYSTIPVLTLIQNRCVYCFFFFCLFVCFFFMWFCDISPCKYGTCIQVSCYKKPPAYPIWKFHVTQMQQLFCFGLIMSFVSWKFQEMVSFILTEVINLILPTLHYQQEEICSSNVFKIECHKSIFRLVSD